MALVKGRFFEVSRMGEVTSGALYSTIYLPTMNVYVKSILVSAHLSGLNQEISWSPDPDLKALNVDPMSPAFDTFFRVSA
jgi:hypothetical protein